jgi:hypothetical protein
MATTAIGPTNLNISTLVEIAHKGGYPRLNWESPRLVAWNGTVWCAFLCKVESEHRTVLNKILRAGLKASPISTLAVINGMAGKEEEQGLIPLLRAIAALPMREQRKLNELCACIQAFLFLPEDLDDKSKTAIRDALFRHRRGMSWLEEQWPLVAWEELAEKTLF